MNLGSKISASIEAPSPAKSDKVIYPTLYVSDVKGFKGLPDGEFAFTGKGKVSMVKHDKKRDTCSFEIEVMDITPEGKAKSTKGLEEELDKIEEEKMSEESDDEMEDEMEDESE